MNLVSPSKNEIRKCIEEDIKDEGFIDQHLYFPCLGALKKIRFKEIDDRIIYGPITMFLINWGRMGRVLDRKNKKGWEDKLKNKIYDLSVLLEMFRGIDLKDYPIDKLEKQIKICYKEISEIVGPTSASKTLHILCPSFFPMWDEKIREETNVTASLKGYYTFIKINQDFIKNYPIVYELAGKFGKPVLKIVDEYFWTSTRE